MGTQRVELGVAGISGSATRAAGFSITAELVSVGAGRVRPHAFTRGSLSVAE